MKWPTPRRDLRSLAFSSRPIPNRSGHGYAGPIGTEEKKAKGEIPLKPMPDGVNCDIDRAPAPEQVARKTSDLIIGAIALAPAAVLAAKKMRDEMKKTA